jgi:hypothetical protein
MQHNSSELEYQQPPVFRIHPEELLTLLFPDTAREISTSPLSLDPAA